MGIRWQRLPSISKQILVLNILLPGRYEASWSPGAGNQNIFPLGYKSIDHVFQAQLLFPQLPVLHLLSRNISIPLEKETSVSLTLVVESGCVFTAHSRVALSDGHALAGGWAGRWGGSVSWLLPSWSYWRFCRDWMLINCLYCTCAVELVQWNECNVNSIPQLLPRPPDAQYHPPLPDKETEARETMTFQRLSLCSFWSVNWFSSVLSGAWISSVASACLWCPAARQASLSITNSWSLLRLMFVESVMPSNHLILCCPLIFLE